MALSCVQIQLVLGHKATLRTKSTPQGFTHNWEVFVRGPEKTNIQNFVDKVVFTLHKDFQKPKRTVKEPNSEGAYAVKESGYGCFSLPIEVYFKNKEEPRKVKFEYELTLQADGPPISCVRYEKMTFKNPSEDFRSKLIKGGGRMVMNSDSGANLLVTSEKVEEPAIAVSGNPSGSYSSGAKKPPGTNDASKKHKSSKESKPEPSNYSDLFGTPSKADKLDKVISNVAEAKKSSSRESSAKKESSASKDSRSSSGGGSSGGSSKSNDSKREKFEKPEKEIKKEIDKTSSTAINKNGKEKELDKKNRKEDKNREETKKSSSKEKSKKAERKDKSKERDRDKEKKELTKESTKETKDSRSSLTSKPQAKADIVPVKPKEVKDDPDLIKRMFKDDLDVGGGVGKKSSSSKEDNDASKKSSRDEKEKASKAAKPIREEPSKVKQEKMNNLFKEISKSEKEKKSDKIRDKKEAAIGKGKTEQRPPSASSITAPVSGPSAKNIKQEKKESIKASTETGKNARLDNKKKNGNGSAASTPVAPAEPVDDVSASKKVVASRTKTGGSKKSRENENDIDNKPQRVNERSRDKVEVKQEVVKRKPEVDSKKQSIVPPQPPPPAEEKSRDANKRKRHSSSTSVSSTSSSSSSSSNSSSSSSSSSSTSSSSSSSKKIAAAPQRLPGVVKPAELPRSSEKEKPIYSSDDDQTIVKANGGLLPASTGVQRGKTLTPTEDRKDKKDKRTPTPSQLKRKRSSSPDNTDSSPAPNGGSSASAEIASDSKKVKVELTDLSLFTPEYLSQLVELQHKIANLNDIKELQRIVDVVESSGSYELSSKMFAFDLCTLDSTTIRRIQQCLT